MNLGLKIKQHLNRKGTTQTFVSEKTKIPIGTLNQMLNGSRNIRAEEYFLICDVLEVPLTFFKETKTARN